MTISLTNEKLTQILTTAYPEVEFAITGDGRHFNITAIGEMFANLKKLQRQQKIYQVINSYLNDGSLHAVVLNLFTPDEYQRNKN
jgi:acid stress-induced BolA-like protein IbaG/YrbA